MRAVTAFVREHLGDVRHERRVVQLASKLFTVTFPWHHLGPDDAAALKLGVMLHDVGRAKDDARHPEIGARMVRKASHLPLSARERRLAAYLARFHRGAVPREGLDDTLRKGEYRRAVMLLALLRAADTLDSRSAGPARVEIRQVGAGVTVTITPVYDTPRARKALGRRKKFRLLQELTGCEIRIRFA
jgi:exopolyphosphatase/guanosine-5'-triphosphate,3'-diphosphate pyrophosphatase